MKGSVSWSWKWPGEFSKWAIKWRVGYHPMLSEEPYDLIENTVTFKFEDGEEIDVTIFDRFPKEVP